MARLAPLTALLVLAVLGVPAGTALAAPADPPGSVRQAELDLPELEVEVGEDAEDEIADGEDLDGVDVEFGDDEDAEDDADAEADDEEATGQTAGHGRSKTSPRHTAKTRDAVIRSLRSRGLKSLSAAFAAPAKGRLTITVSGGGRKLMQASKAVRKGSAHLQVRPTAGGARAARSRKHATLVVTVRFQAPGKRAETSTGRVRI